MARRKSPSLADEIVRLMREQPKNWHCSSYTAEHLPTGLCVWVANGPLFVEVYRDPKVSFGFFDKLAIWIAYKRLSRGFWLAKLEIA